MLQYIDPDQTAQMYRLFIYVLRSLPTWRGSGFFCYFFFVCFLCVFLIILLLLLLLLLLLYFNLKQPVWYSFLENRICYFIQNVSKETICMECQPQFSGEIKKSISKFLPLKVLPSMLSLNPCPAE